MKIPEVSINKLKLLSGSGLKLIAVISMLADHFAVAFYSAESFLAEPMFSVFTKGITLYFMLRSVGRLAFPLFCFLMAEGFYYTKNLKKYILTILGFALISEIPFNLMVNGKVFFFGKQNVFFTLFFGALILYILKSNIQKVFKFIFAVLIIIILPYANLDYGLSGVILIVLLYLLRDRRLCQIICSYPLLAGGPIAWCGILLTVFYNGKRGFIKGNLVKYVFYVVYPLHIIVLVLIKNLVY